MSTLEEDDSHHAVLDEPFTTASGLEGRRRIFGARPQSVRRLGYHVLAGDGRLVTLSITFRERVGPAVWLPFDTQVHEGFTRIESEPGDGRSPAEVSEHQRFSGLPSAP